MATASDFIPNLSTAQILNVVLIILVTVLAVGAIGTFLWYMFKKKKYNQYRIEITDTDNNGNIYREYDRAGVFLDKKVNMRLLWLEKYKVGLNPNNIPYISTRDRKGRIIRTVEIQRIGVNNYVFLRRNVSKDKVEITVGEEDQNNAAAEMTKIRKTYDKKSWLKEHFALIMGIIVIMIIMVMLIVLFNKFGILKEVADNLLQVTQLQKTITEQLYNISINPGINTNAPIIVPGGG